jgi:TM2 domain-containing membrane protein YozV
VAIVGPSRATKLCGACGTTVDAMAEICPYCGVRQGALMTTGDSPKRILPAMILCFCFGIFGVHRFYVGKVGTGLLQLFTIGGLGVWAMIDFIMLVVGAFTDKQGRKIVEWT